ncbi:CBS domain-containing protein [Bacillus aquiflavi]|uniref:CBS domain-containing protein n=1 Tax=Bacillus aquiflavi TaxID=2672567 RepID=A0A6B3W348_9BACI|nr:cyclic-di-AMP-binding protein CbpB [Bacillus aquiflavi]MBA4538075.1 CBS domain-containing protein [Bacillus aquiflavi]NEY82373.1 CBS domain-containing protein [Bacillus aquiflavi]UAC49232.1 CBS domain-containing protein [Bacillus aquiflavi]
MISLYSGEFIENNLKDLMISSERVAHVQIGNSLEHALLVLTKSGYTAIPVLDPHYKLHGLISTPIIMEAILGLERIEFEKLEEKRVEEVMNRTVPRLKINATMNAYLELLVDHPFLCVEDENGYFEGILTRRAVLKQLNQYVHKLNRYTKAPK